MLKHEIHHSIKLMKDVWKIIKSNEKNIRLSIEELEMKRK